LNLIDREKYDDGAEESGQIIAYRWQLSHQANDLLVDSEFFNDSNDDLPF